MPYRETDFHSFSLSTHRLRQYQLFSPASSRSWCSTAACIARLDSAVEHFLDNCVAPVTRTAYRSGQLRYAAFCQPYPLQEDTLCRYVAHLAGEGGAQTLHNQGFLVSYSLPATERDGQPFYKWIYATPGICAWGDQARGDLLRPSDTHKTTYYSRHTDEAAGHMASSLMLWVAACIGFFGFQWAGEFTVPSAEAYDPEVYLNLGDHALDSHTHTQLWSASKSRARQIHSDKV